MGEISNTPPHTKDHMMQLHPLESHDTHNIILFKAYICPIIINDKVTGEVESARGRNRFTQETILLPLSIGQ